MLALRLIRGSRPLVLLRRLLLACAAAGVGFLLLAALGHALAHPHRSTDSLVRLLWCAVPLTAAVQLAATDARTATGVRARSGLDAAGLGPVGFAALAATSTAICYLLGSVAALLAFLHLRGELTCMPFDGAAAGLLAADRPLPLAAVFTLLCVAPVVASAAAAYATRPRGPRQSTQRGTRRKLRRAARAGAPDATAPVPVPPPRDALGTPAPDAVPGSLFLATALVCAGLALEAYAGRSAFSASPFRLEGLSPGVLGGWLLTALGLILAGPGLLHLCGRLIATGRPGSLRLLAGRTLQGEALRVGRPSGVLCAAVAGGPVAAGLYATVAAAASAGPAGAAGSAAGRGGMGALGPTTVLGIALVMCCATASVLTAAAECRAARGATTAELVRLGASGRLLRRAVLLRTVVAVAVLAPLAWAVGALAALPVSP